MRTGTALLATMEHALATSALIQLEHFVGLPTDVLGFATESKTLDMQSGIERTYAAILAYLAGADILSGAGGLESVKTGSLEQLAIDDEICSVLKRMRRGIEVTDITLGVDLVDRIGIGGNYLSDIHTRKFFRSEHLILELFDHDVRAVWEASGRKDMAQRAREKALKILGEHQPAPLDKVVEREVRTLMQLARRELGG
jgi:trimethylamine--corrinoid protein Co-methyltransferase